MTLCTFKNQSQPCVAEAKPDSPRQWCPPHEAMRLHDYALAFRRRQKRFSQIDVTRWAETRGLDVAALEAIAPGAKPLTVRSVEEVDAL